MSNALQNRLVGTIILVAVTVIFLPDYLDGKKQTNTETFVDFPRSTSNLSAVAPDPFPAEQVANATRREVEIVDELPADDLLTQNNSTNNTNDTTGKVTVTDNTDEELRMAELLANNVKASEVKDPGAKVIETVANKTKTSESAKLATQPSIPANAATSSLAQQTIAKTAAANANDNAGWVVQLGSFGNQKNVNDLLRKLEKAGYRTFSRKVQTSAGRLTKVFVGPELDKEKLDLALPHLKQTTGLTGKVTTFSVVSD